MGACADPCFVAQLTRFPQYWTGCLFGCLLLFLKKKKEELISEQEPEQAPGRVLWETCQLGHMATIGTSTRASTQLHSCKSLRISPSGRQSKDRHAPKREPGHLQWEIILHDGTERGFTQHTGPQMPRRPNLMTPPLRIHSAPSPVDVRNTPAVFRSTRGFRDNFVTQGPGRLTVVWTTSEQAPSKLI